MTISNSHPGPNGDPVCTPVLSPDETNAVIAAVVTANGGPSALTPAQTMVTNAVAHAVADHPVEVSEVAAVGPQDLAELIDAPNRDDGLAAHILRYMGLVALLVKPVPVEVTDRIESYADALGAGEAERRVWSFPSQGAESAAIYDFSRNGYASEFDGHRFGSHLHVDGETPDGWATVTDDPELVERWEHLKDCPDGSIGREVYDFYCGREFVFPGEPKSTPPLLAQHDWVHVLADYGTRVTCELEVFGLISASDDLPGGFSLLAMVIGLFATGSVDQAAGLFEADPGHLSSQNAAIRLADALRRGGCITRPDGRRDGGLMAMDWFAYAETPLDEMRRLCNVPPKSQRAIDAGSPGTWDVAGLSEYQKSHCRMDVIARYSPST